MTYDKITDLRNVPLSSDDFGALRERYGAFKNGTEMLPNFLLIGAAPAYRLAAQIDLDRFHAGEDCVLDWDEILADMDPADDRTTQERRADEYANSIEKG